MNINDLKLEEINNKFIDAMSKAKGRSWLKPFISNSTGMLPFNAHAKNTYNGINIWILNCTQNDKGYNSNEWATFKQIQKMKGMVNKGEKGTSIVLYKQINIKDAQTDEIKSIPMMRFFSVFNLDQTTLKRDVIKKPKINKVKAMKHIDKYVDNLKLDIRHNGNGQCYYKPSEDFINMTAKEDFLKVDASTETETYYSTLLHEIAHAVCHKDRLDIDMKSYALEELYAEITSALQCQIQGIETVMHQNHATYLNSWIKHIKEDKKALLTCCAKAMKSIKWQDEQQQQ